MKTRFSKSENGFVLAWTAAMLVLFLLMAALAVDLGYWYFKKNDIQRAADAAASAAVIVRTSERGTAIADASTLALEVASRNGYTNGGSISVLGSTTDAVGNPLPPNQYRVVIRQDISNFFLKIVGMSSTRIVAESTAQFTAPVQLGSPSNVFGKEPIFPGEPSWNNSTLPTPQMWATIGSPQNRVTGGDPFQSNNCSYSSAPPDNESPPDVCGGGPTNPLYTAEGSSGYNIVIKTENIAAGDRLEVQLYDPAFAEQGMGCLTGPAYRLGRFLPADPHYSTPAGAITAATPVPSNCAGDTSVNSCFGGWEDCGGGGGGGGGFATLGSKKHPSELEPTDAGCGIRPCNTLTRPSTRYRLFAPSNGPNIVDLSQSPLSEDRFGYYWSSYSSDQADLSGNNAPGGGCILRTFFGFPLSTSPRCFGTPSNFGSNSDDGLIANYQYNALDIVGNFGIECSGSKQAVFGIVNRCAWNSTEDSFYYNRNDILDAASRPTNSATDWSSRIGGETIPNEIGQTVGRFGGHKFRDTYHKWVNFASIPNATAGYYILNVTTADAYTGQTSRGMNNFSVRARIVGSPTAKVSTFPYQRMAVQANVSGTSDQYVAKVPNGPSPGKSLIMTSFDLGDIAECSTTGPFFYPDPKSCQRAATSVAGTLSFGRYAPSFTQLPTCKIAIGYSSNVFVDTPGCQIPLDSSTLGSKTLKVLVPLDSFSCAGDTCWVLARTTMPTSNGTKVILPSDSMAWTAKVEGDPVSITN